MALTINSFASASGTGNPSGGTVTVTLPGTPQVDDSYVIVAVAYNGTGAATIDWTSGSGSGWTVNHQSTNLVTGKRFLASRAWQSGDATTQTLEVVSLGSAWKWLFVGAYLIRPAASNTVTFRTFGTGFGTSAATDSVTLGTAPVSDDAVVVGHMNDDKGTAYSNWVNGAFALTENAELTAGSGSPSNWSSAGFASGITTSTSTTVSVDHNTTGAAFAMVAGAFYEVASGGSVSDPPRPMLRRNLHLIGR